MHRPNVLAGGQSIGSGITYIHDPIGRLVGVVDPTQGVAVYRYDAVGNILSIARYPITRLLVIEATPRQVKPGGQLTVWGNGFDPTPANDAVQIGTVLATVTAATPTQLTVKAPSSKVVGKISVTAGGHTASSSFTETVANLAPSVTSVSPTIAVPGASITVTGRNFSPQTELDRVTIGGTFVPVTAATNTSLTITMPPFSTGGSVTVSTPTGTAATSIDVVVDGNPSSIVSVGRLTPNVTQTVQVPATGSAVLLMELEKGSRLVVQTSNPNPPGYNPSVSVFAPDGQSVCCPFSLFTPPVKLGGTYRVFVTTTNSTAGSIDLLASASNDTVGSIVPNGDPVTVTVSTVGGGAVLTFPGTAGQRASVSMTDVGFAGTLALQLPDGTPLAKTATATGGFLDATTLPLTATYRLSVLADSTWTGSATVQLYVFNDVTGTIEPNVPTDISNTIPGQNIELTFPGTAGQRVSMELLNPTWGGHCWILNPDGTVLSYGFFSAGMSTFLDAATFPTDGTYSLLVDPDGSSVGSANVTVYTFDDLSGTLTLDGSPVTADFGIPGQNGAYTFDGTAGQRISISTTNPFSGGVSIALKDSGGNTVAVANRYTNPDGTFDDFIEAMNLPATDTYSLSIDPYRDATGTATLSAFVVSDITHKVSSNGTVYTVTTTTPGQNFLGTFNAVTGKTATYTLTTDTVSYGSASLLAPDGLILGSGHFTKGFIDTVTIGPLTLPQSGTYQAVVDPDGPYTGQVHGSVTVTTRRQSSSPSSAGMSSLRADQSHPEPRPPQSLASAASKSGPAPRSCTQTPLTRQLDAAAASGSLPAEITAVTGLVKDSATGRPLPNITLSIEGAHACTDASGAFVLSMPPGQKVMEIDGTKAAHNYGFYEDGINVQERKLTVLPYTIWLTRLDTAHEVYIPSPTTKRTVIANPQIPGLALILPAGTVIRDHDNHIVHRLGITPIPVNRPPFPLPVGLAVPVYFTIQPGAAYVRPYGARLIYPNVNNQPPGARVTFWDYNPDEHTWFIYGHGRVSKDGKLIIPDKNTRIWEFSGAMIQGGSCDGPPPPCPPDTPRLDPDTPGDSCPVVGPPDTGGDPVDLSTGLFVYARTDLYEPDTIPISIGSTYRQLDPVVRSFGIGDTFAMDLHVWSGDPASQITFVQPDGSSVDYLPVANAYGLGLIYASIQTPSKFVSSYLAYDLDDGSYHMRTRDGMVDSFNTSTGLLVAISDANENSLTNQGESLYYSPHGRWALAERAQTGLIIGAIDSAGRSVLYGYGAAYGELDTITDATSAVTTFGWTNGSITSVTDARGNIWLTNTYGPDGRVQSQTLANGGVYQFAYQTNASNQVLSTTVTDPRGIISTTDFDDRGYANDRTDAVGTADQVTRSWQRDPATRQVTTAIDPRGVQTTYTYDAEGDATAVTYAAGSPIAGTYTATFDITSFPEPQAISDPLGHTVRYSYDAAGNLSTVSDDLGRKGSLSYDVDGQLVAVLDPAKNRTSAFYDHGDLANLRDPLGRTTSFLFDGAGRAVATTSPSGARAAVLYNNYGEVTNQTDALNQITSLAYDPVGNLISLMDARGNTTTWAFNPSNQITSRTDGLGVQDFFTYDLDGNQVSHTLRDGTRDDDAFDNLNRLRIASFGAANRAYDTTVQYIYDPSSRLVEVIDSVGGTIARTYDDRDRLLKETTPQGAISYGYDQASRQTRMTLSGQPLVRYDYDNADQLTRIQGAPGIASFVHDVDGRLAKLTYPTGMVMQRSYDAASQLVSIIYSQATTTVGDLAYNYDLSGRRTAVTGTLAAMSLPAADSTRTYNADNEALTANGATLAYDTRGDLTDDGTHTYQWNARGQLTSIDGTADAFTYDGFGRRTTSSVGGSLTVFRYEGNNPVQQTTGPLKDSYLTAFGPDSYLTVTEGSTTSGMISDALGSVVGLTDSSGTVQTTYTYDPYGSATRTGASQSNSRQFTGRENDSTGLDFFRARYYMPSLGRFVSQDPLDLAAGPNEYAYVGDNPVDTTDWSGMSSSQDCVPYLDLTIDGGVPGLDCKFKPDPPGEPGSTPPPPPPPPPPGWFPPPPPPPPPGCHETGLSCNKGGCRILCIDTNLRAQDACGAAAGLAGMAGGRAPLGLSLGIGAVAGWAWQYCTRNTPPGATF